MKYLLETKSKVGGCGSFGRWILDLSPYTTIGAARVLRKNIRIMSKQNNGEDVLVSYFGSNIFSDEPLDQFWGSEITKI